jgi:hypothetical protein
MGRPLNKKYFGKRNTGAAGTYGNTNLLPTDYDLGGLKALGIGSITAGSFTGAQADAATFTFPTPALASEGAVTAVGTPTFTTLTATISGSQTRAYPATAGAIIVGSGTTASTYTATLRTQALTTVAYSSATQISFDTTTTAYISGTNITISGASITGNMTIGGVAIAAGQTYYLGAPTTATAATLYATYQNAVNATSPLAISNGTTTGATFTVGATYSTVTAVTVVSGGTIKSGAVTAYNAATVVTTTDGTGSSLSVTPATFGINGVTYTNTGNGYINTVPVTPSITSTTLTAISAFTSSGFSSTSLTGSYLLATPQSAGTFYVGQVLTLTGSNTGTTITGYSTGKSYLVKTTNGTSTFTLTNIDGTAVANGTASGDIVGLTINLYKATVGSTDQLVPGLKVVTTGTGGSLTAGTYYIIAVNGATEIVLSSSVGGNATAVTTATSTATTVVSGNVVVTIGNNQSAAASMTFAAQVTTGYTGNYAAIQAQALATTGGVVRQDTDIVKQENTQRFRVENADGVFYAKLVNAFPTVGGTMAINATDFNGSTYWVTKITNRRCRVTQNVVKTSFQFADGATVNWTFGSAVTGVSVKIDNA